MGQNSSFLDPLLSPTHQDDGTPLPRRANINYVGFSVADNPTTDATDITNTGGSTAIAVADIAALRAASHTDKEVATVASPVGQWVYSSSQGAGQADDGATVVKPGDVSLGADGRWYNVNTSPVLPDIASLRLAVSGVQPSIQVQTFSAPADGGGGIFDYDSSDTTSADDGGTIIVAGARRYKRRYVGAISIAWFGAGHGDVTGVEDRTAIQNTFNLTATLSGTKSQAIEFPLVDGGYFLDQGLVLQGRLGGQAMALRSDLPQGNGSLGVILHYVGSNVGETFVLNCLGNWGLTIDGISLDAGDKAKYGLILQPDQVNVIGTSDIVLNRMMIQGCRNVAGATHLALGSPAGGAISQCDNVKIYDLTIIGKTGTPGYLADGITNFQGNNTKGIWLYNVGVNACRHGANFALYNGPVAFYGGVMNGQYLSALHLGSPNLSIYDMDFEGNNVFITSAGTGNGSGSLQLQDVTVYDFQLVVADGWDIGINYLGGPIKKLGCVFQNLRQMAVTVASNTTPVTLTITPQSGETDHHLQTGDFIEVQGVTGNAGAIGGFFIHRVDATHVTLDGSVGTGAGTGGILTPEYQTQIRDQTVGFSTGSYYSEGTIYFTAPLSGPRVKDDAGLELRSAAVAQANDVRYRIRNCAALVGGNLESRMIDIDSRNVRGRTGITLSPKTVTLANADATLAVANGNQYVCLPATLTANRTLTLSPTAVINNTVMLWREDATAHSLAVVNGGPAAGTLDTLPNGTTGLWIWAFDGVDWYTVVAGLKLS